MKRIIRKIICVAAVVLAAVSCQKSIEPSNPVEEGSEIIDIRKTINICVNGLMGEYTQVDATKAELVNTVRVSWEGGETVYVFDGVKCLGSLAASLEGTEDRYAILSTDGTHTVSTPAAGTTTLTLVYSPLLTEAPAVSNGAISISLASQSGEKAPFVAYAKLNYTSTTITNAVVPFKFATSVIKVNCTGLKPGTAITSATLSNVNTACKLTLSGSDAPTVSGGTNGTITRTGDEYFAATKVNDEGEAVFQIAVPKLETASGARVLTVAQGSDEVKDKNFSKKAINPATSVNTVCQLVELPAGALKGEFSVSATKQVYFSQGNLVAKIDASGAPTDWKFAANQYDCIGEGGANKTIGSTAGDVDLFGWSTSSDNYGIKTSRSSIDYSGEFYDWGKAYCEKNSIAEGTWRTLSTAEWQYLFNYGEFKSDVRNGKYKWATVNGVNGYVIAPDDFSGTLSSEYTDDAALADAGNLVFLPAAGYRNGGPLISSVGEYGSYWSSTAVDKEWVYLVRFYKNIVMPHDTDIRPFGRSVRLITE